MADGPGEQGLGTIAHAAWIAGLAWTAATAIALACALLSSPAVAHRLMLASGGAGALAVVFAARRGSDARRLTGPAGRAEAAPVGPASDERLLVDRLSAIGALAASVAHELRQPVSYVGSNLDHALGTLRSALADPPSAPGRIADALAALEDADDGARRIATLVADLGSLSRPSRPAEEGVSIELPLRAAVRMAHDAVVARARLELALPALPRVAGSDHRLTQVFVNLLLNAAQATPEGRPGEHAIRVRAFLASPDRVAVEVADDGLGIAAEDLARLFEPFFTRRPGGTGLGLFVSRTIVEGFGGAITAAAGKGRGAVFRVELPVAGEVAPAAGPAPEA